MQYSKIAPVSLLTLTLIGASSQSIASVTAAEMGFTPAPAQTEKDLKDAKYVFVIEINNATFSPAGGDRYTLQFNAKDMTTIDAMSRPPYAKVEKLTAKEFGKMAHSGGKESFDANPPNFFLNIDHKLRGSFALVGYEKKGDSTIVYELKALPFYPNGYSKDKKPHPNPVIPKQAISGHASLLLDDRGMFDGL